MAFHHAQCNAALLASGYTSPSLHPSTDGIMKPDLHKYGNDRDVRDAPASAEDQAWTKDKTAHLVQNMSYWYNQMYGAPFVVDHSAPVCSLPDQFGLRPLQVSGLSCPFDGYWLAKYTPRQAMVWKLYHSMNF